eukprot:4582843-Prymnesium_polylepis.1
MPWRSSKASPFASAHEMRWRWQRRKVLARRPPAEPECRAACTPAISRRVREAVRWRPRYVSWMIGRTSTARCSAPW